MRPVGSAALAVLLALTLRTERADARQPYLAGRHDDMAKVFGEVVRTETGILAMTSNSLTHLTIAARPDPARLSDTFTEEGTFTPGGVFADVTYDMVALNKAYGLYTDGTILCIDWSVRSSPATLYTGSVGLSGCAKLRLSHLGSSTFLVVICRKDIVVFEVLANSFFSHGVADLSAVTTEDCLHLEVGHYDTTRACYWLGCGGYLLYLTATIATITSGSPVSIHQAESFTGQTTVFDIWASGATAWVGWVHNVPGGTLTVNLLDLYTGGASLAALTHDRETTAATSDSIALVQDPTNTYDVYVSRFTGMDLLPLYVLNAPFTYYPGSMSLTHRPTDALLSYDNTLIMGAEGRITLYLLELPQVYCDVYTCSGGFTLKALAQAILCGSDSSLCTDVTCCDPQPKCDTYTCPAMTGHVLKVSPATISCSSTCDTSTCCDLTCDVFACGVGYQDKAMKSGILCLNGAPMACDETTCCDVEVKCNDGAGHTCPMGFQDKA
eukprot:Rhum_TRINITY_DN8314_c0_g1::Rhum_TRINITY_DN8314_c0_g1_i1::g.27303::m.27303